MRYSTGMVFVPIDAPVVLEKRASLRRCRFCGSASAIFFQAWQWQAILRNRVDAPHDKLACPG
jgi:hypothetical protein